MTNTDYLSQLAPELLLEITSHLHHAKDRASLTRTCRHVYAATTGKLYECFVYNGDVQESWRFVAFVRTIIENPDIAALVKVFDFEDRSYMHTPDGLGEEQVLHDYRQMGYDMYRQYVDQRLGKRSLSEAESSTDEVARSSRGSRPREKKERFERRTKELSRVFENALLEIGFSEINVQRWAEEFAPWRFMTKRKPEYYSDADFAVMMPLLCILLLRLPSLRKVILHPDQPGWMPHLYLSAIKFVADRLKASYPRPATQLDASTGLQNMELGPRGDHPNLLAHLQVMQITFFPGANFELHDVLRIFLPFMQLPNLHTLYATGNNEFYIDNDGSPDVIPSAYIGTSNVTEVSLEDADITVQQLLVLLRACKKLERFRWTRGQGRNPVDLSIDPDLTPNFDRRVGIQQALDPHASTLEELDLRIYLEHCNNKVYNDGYHVRSLTNFTNLTTLTITPVVFYIGQYDWGKEIDLGSLLPKSLEYLGLVYVFGSLKDRCICDISNDHRAWIGCVLKLARTISDSLPLCKRVEIFRSRGESRVSSHDQRNTDELLKITYHAFLRSGVSTNIFHILENDPLPPL
jgi:hypothetical protein